MTSPSLSIVMPAYNAAPHIAAAIGSVQAQTFGDFELIVVDDCSTDATASVVQDIAAVDPRVRCVRLPANMGAPAGPRNEGVRQARAPWVAFIDADDLWHPGKLAAQWQVIEDTGAQFCSTRMVNFSSPALPAFPTTPAPGVEWVTFFDQLVKYRTPMSSVMVRKTLLETFPFNESPAYKAREDLDCWLHIHEVIGRSVKLKAVLVGYRIDPGQISGRKWVMVQRHFHVLRRYVFRSGRRLGWGAVPFTVTHFVMSPFYRLFRKGL